MRKLYVSCIVLSLMVLGSHAALALPFLQLDISDSIYDTSTETVVSTSDQFDLYGLVNSKSKDFDLNATYYVAASILPDGSGSGNFGTFTVDGQTISSSDMNYGTPDGLPSHGVYDAYYTEFAFNLNSSDRAKNYNVEDSPGSLETSSKGGLYYFDYAIDTSGLASGYEVHFDLYTKNADGSVSKFAPFSHDAQSFGGDNDGGDPPPPPPVYAVPEPGTIILLGLGLLGLLGYTRKLKK